MESSADIDGKVAPSLHKHSFSGSQKPFMMVPQEKLVSVPISSEILIAFIWHPKDILA